MRRRPALAVNSGWATTYARRFAALMLAVVLGACAGEGSQVEVGDDSAATSSPLATTTITAATTTTAAAVTTSQPIATTTSQPTTAATDGLADSIAYGATVLVEGREDCDLEPMVQEPTVSTDSDGTVLFRDGRFECTVTNSDPRLAGTAYYTLDLNRWISEAPQAAQVMWGTIRIENENGAWESDEYVGVYTSKLGDVFTALFTGTGDYEGLFYYQWAVETFGANWPTKGLIYPSDHGPPAGFGSHG